MKKIITSVLMLMLSAQLFAQKIVFDKEKGGMRAVGTSLTVCRNFTDKVIFSFGLSAYCADDTTAYDLNVKLVSAEKLDIEKDSKLLIKTDKGEIFELRANMDAEHSLPHNEVIGKSIFTSYNVLSSYPISRTDLERLCSSNIIKVRVQAFNSVIDKEYRKDKVGAVFKKDLAILDDYLAKKHDIRDGF